MRYLPFLLLVLGCPPAPPNDDTSINETGGSTDCTPPLTLTTDYPAVLPHHPLKLYASGGTGAYEFELVDSDSKAILNELTGTYLASDETGTSDEIVVTDSECEGSASLTIDTIEAFEAQPDGLSLLPGMQFEPEITGGSSDITCELLLHPSGASLSGCLYSAGATEANDILRITDNQTGHSKDISVLVDPNTGLDDVITLILLPVGGTYDAQATGGSGVFDYTVESGAAEISDGQITAVVPGESTVRIKDHFVGFETTLTIIAAEVISPPHPVDGELVFFGRAEGGEDLNGDGYDDAILGVYSGSYSQYFGGLVSVYAGGPDGPNITPVQTLGGTQFKAQFGRSVALGDFNGDNEMDLAVGAPEAPEDGTTTGLVFIYEGLEDSFFDDTPKMTLEGDYSGDRLGAGMASCDLNKDGYDDLIVGARAAEDRDASSIQYSEGGLYIYEGSPAGLSSTADDYRWGIDANYLLGVDVKVGDFNNDGHCDVLAGSENYASGTAGEEGGALLFYNDTTGQLEMQPAISVLGPGRIGLKMAVGDLDDDGLDDFALGGWRAPNPSGNSYAGTTSVFLGASLQSLASNTTLRTTDADWLFYGDKANQYMGREVSIGDGNGDGIDDLMISVSAGELSGQPANAGVLSLYPGGSATQPTTAEQEWTLSESYAYLGSALGYAGHMDDDGLGDWLVLSDRAVVYGPDSGAPYVVSAGETEPLLLDFDNKSSGHNFGYHGSMAWIEATGDEHLDLVFSGAGAGNAADQANAGVLYTLAGTADGLDPTPISLDLYDKEWGSNSRKGFQVINIGDFSQNGHDDVLVLSRDEGKPNSMDRNVYANPDDCSGSVSGGGMGLIYPGSAAGLGDDAVFAYFGPYTYDDLQVGLGNLDVNGDGQPDAVIGSTFWNARRGGVAVIPGRSPTSSKTEIICGPTEIWGGSGADDFAFSLAAIGHLDGDACEEFVVGAPSDSTLGGGGSVSLVWGWDPNSCTGANCCPNEPKVTTLKTDLSSVDFGQVLETIDLDGDGFKELLIGLPDSTTGGAFVVQGASLAGLNRESLNAGAVSSTDMGQVYSIESLPNTFRISSQLDSGEGLSAIPHPNGEGALVAFGNTPEAGGGRIVSFTPAHPMGKTVAIIAGESENSGGLLGQGMVLRATGFDLSLIVGAPEHDAPDGIDQGGFYPFLFELD